METPAEAGLVQYKFTATTMGYRYGDVVWAKPSEWFDQMVAKGKLIRVGEVDDGNQPEEPGDSPDVSSPESLDADSGQGAGGGEA